MGAPEAAMRTSGCPLEALWPSWGASKFTEKPLVFVVQAISMANVIKPMFVLKYSDGRRNKTKDFNIMSMANVIQPMVFDYSDGKRYGTHIV